MRCLTPDLHRASLEIPEEGIPVNFGFLLDRLYLSSKNMSGSPSTGPDIHIQIYPDPIIEPFEEHGHTKPYDKNKHLALKVCYIVWYWETLHGNF